MEEEKSYCGQPVTKCAKIVAWIGFILSAIGFIAVIPTDLLQAATHFLSALSYNIAIAGLYKRRPKLMFISSITVLFSAVIYAAWIIVFIIQAITLSNEYIQIFKQLEITKDHVEAFTRIIFIACAFGSLLRVFFALYAYFLFSNARKYYLQKGI